jgi:hypothetical protein
MADKQFKIILCEKCKHAHLLYGEDLEPDYEFECDHCHHDKFKELSSWEAAKMCDCYNFVKDSGSWGLDDRVLVGTKYFKELEKRKPND